MSEPIPEAVPTSQDPRSRRPLKKKRGLTSTSQQAASVEALFANPEREIVMPTGPRVKQLAPPPEIVQNVQGSSAGAGSGEFHVYKASRRREYERLRLMDEESKKEHDDAAFERGRDERQRKDDEKTRRNREKREKAKKRKKAGKGKQQEDDEDEDDGGGPEKKKNMGNNGTARAGLGPRPVVHAENEDSVVSEAAGKVETQDHDEPENAGITIHDDD